MTRLAAEHAERLRRPATVRSVQLGDMTMTYVPDGYVQLPPRGWLPDTTDEVWDAHPEYLDESGHLVASIGALLVERGQSALLIDAGFGPQVLPPDPGTPRGAIHGGALMHNLASLGRGPDTIQAVAFTHFHPDHLGWAWTPAPGDTRPALAAAGYLVAEPEWSDRHQLDSHGITADVITAMAPYVRTVRDGDEIFPGVRIRVSGGHTRGHAEYVITAGGQRLIAFGDALHSPIQVGHPEWSAAVDHDPARAATHRRQLVAELSEPDTIGYGSHFADVVFGRVRRDGVENVWCPLDD